MTVRWITPAGDLGIVVERLRQNIPLTASSDVGPIIFTLLAGVLPRGLRLAESSEHDSTQSSINIIGSPTEVRRFTTSRFVIRADDGKDIEDRTFSISVDGSDEPVWITREGFLNVGQGENYFVLDNAFVDFQLEAYDPDELAGDVLEYRLVAQGGELPPGLTLTSEGRITGFTDPVFAIDTISSGGYDIGAFDITYFDRHDPKSTGYDTYLYDLQTFDFNEPAQVPRRLSRFYTFIVAVSDGANEVKRLFRIWVVTDEFLKSDNTIVQVDTNLFRADNTSNRIPIWITESDLGVHRANNYLTIYLDVYDPPSLSGTIAYLLVPNNPDGSISELPPGMTLNSTTGEIAGKVPYQSRVSKNYQFTMQAIDFPAALANINYVLQGDWNNSARYFVNQAVRHRGFIYVCIFEHRNQIPDSVDSVYWKPSVATAEKTFTIEIIGEIDSAIEWISDSDLGSIRANQPSMLAVEATSLLYGGRVIYSIIEGKLPPGLELLGTGDIVGKVKQFGDDNGPGLTRFYERIDSTEDSSTLSRSYTSSFDRGSTSFDKVFRFKIKARDTSNFAERIKEFSVRVIADNTKTFANLYLKSFPSKQKRLEWFDFISDNNIFRPEEIYRYGDENFGIQTEIKMLIYAGIENLEAVNYVQAMSRNHYKKRLLFGDLKFAAAKDPKTQKDLYEVIYVDIVDEFEKNGKSISQTIELPDYLNSKVLVSYDAIKIDSNIPLVSDRDHQRIFPNSFKNMRRHLRSLGERDRTFLPLWMRSIQDQDFVESGYLSVMVICYVKPGLSRKIISRIKGRTVFASRGQWDPTTSYRINDSVIYQGRYYTASFDNLSKTPNLEPDFWIKNFDFKSLDFEADRYVIDVLDGQTENSYLAFPQRDILNKLLNNTGKQIPESIIVNVTFDSFLITFDNTVLQFNQG